MRTHLLWVDALNWFVYGWPCKRRLNTWPCFGYNTSGLRSACADGPLCSNQCQLAHAL